MKYLLSLAIILAFAACGDNKKEQTQEAPKQELVKSVTPVAPVKEKVIDKKAPVAEVKKVEAPIEEPELEKPEPVQKTTPIKEEVVAEKAPTKAPEQKKVTNTIHPPLVKEVVDVKALFTKCSACHGTHAEKHALGKSHIINEWKATKIASAIYGYQDGTYGGAMKAAMQGQVKGLSDAEVKALADYISKLK